MLASQSRASSGHGAMMASSSSSSMPLRRAPTLLPARGAMAASCSGQASAAAAAAATCARRGSGSEQRLRGAAAALARRGAAACCRAIEEKRDTTGEAAGAPSDLISDIERLAALRRADGAPEPSQQPPGGGMQNPLQGAASEARLITWPGPQKALLDTALVLGIVAGTSALVFGINVAFAELAGAWYGRGG